MKKHIKKMIFPFLFIGLLTVMSVFTFANRGNNYSENEKRFLAVFPEFSVKTVINGSFQDGLEEYISDHLTGREFFVGVDAYFSKLMGKNALGNIYTTKDGYLINAPGKPPEGDTTDHFQKNINNFESFTLLNNIKSSLVIVPSAGYIMEDKLPMFHKKYNDDKLIVKAAESTPSVRFFDARLPLAEAYSEGKQVYYRTDHHITSLGSYELYRAYCDFAGLDCPSKDDYKVTSYSDFYGTTYSGSGYWLIKPDDIEVWDLGEKVSVEFEDGEIHNSMFFTEHLESPDKYPVYLDGNHSYVKIENPNAKGGTLLVIRDSYGQNFAPFLSHNYKKIILLDMRYWRNSLLLLTSSEKVDEILYLYGIDTLISDSSTSYLFF